MIAMQYRFVLPADYDMAVIERRIAGKGHLLDGFPGLLLKAYLSANKRGGGPTDNLYAPFYLWRDNEAMSAFLCGPGFVAVSQAFGWPAVQTWSVWHAEQAADVARARYATRETLAIASHTALERLRADETAAARLSFERDGALAVAVGFEPRTWTLVRFSLWREPDGGAGGDRVQRYAVGHVSLPNNAGATQHPGV
ncbi:MULTISPECIES: DUF4865 family protein [unclassified Janthinobacterium]|uniref:DUF4865 family protein n=1 Tax=unclassified Janthinobacterium TaxID=2610881 RepID=UPI00034C0E7E|nr:MULTISPECIES: DUF4865 family protein [unclassified Janthinobacterium]MEC5160669.1 hypothetical protein [Janthinobacterium sp. CG_S6]